MSKQTFHIPKISCGHCVMAIKNELSELDGVRAVDGTPDTKTVVVEWGAPASEAVIRERLQDINYPAE
jgi:copper chaperone